MEAHAITQLVIELAKLNGIEVVATDPPIRETRVIEITTTTDPVDGSPRLTKSERVIKPIQLTVSGTVDVQQTALTIVQGMTARSEKRLAFHCEVKGGIVHGNYGALSDEQSQQ